jgi:hypothetical protein
VTPEELVGEGGVIRKRNGSRFDDWISGTSQRLEGVWAAWLDEAWAVGAAGTIRHWNGVARADFASPTTVDLHGVWGASPHEGWAVGSGGTILRWLEYTVLIWLTGRGAT